MSMKYEVKNIMNTDFFILKYFLNCLVFRHQIFAMYQCKHCYNLFRELIKLLIKQFRIKLRISNNFFEIFAEIVHFN